jgi:NTE family protein
MDKASYSNVGIVLSGGGVRGMAHIGALKALESFEWEPHWISGTSAGALVGALYAKGLRGQEMLRFFRDTPLFRYNFFSITKPGLFDTERYYKIFESYWPENSFEALAKPLFVATTNLQKGEVVIFHKGELIHPLLASAAIPPIFSPVRIGGELYADGGIMNNFPVEPLLGKADFLLGSNVSGIDEIPGKEIKSSIQLATRTTGLMLYAPIREKLKQCDLLFQPMGLEKIGTLDKRGLEKAFTMGYDHACEILDKTFIP